MTMKIKKGSKGAEIESSCNRYSECNLQTRLVFVRRTCISIVQINIKNLQLQMHQKCLLILLKNFHLKECPQISPPFRSFYYT